MILWYLFVCQPLVVCMCMCVSVCLSLWTSVCVIWVCTVPFICVWVDGGWVLAEHAPRRVSLSPSVQLSCFHSNAFSGTDMMHVCTNTHTHTDCLYLKNHRELKQTSTGLWTNQKLSEHLKMQSKNSRDVSLRETFTWDQLACGRAARPRTNTHTQTPTYTQTHIISSISLSLP